MHEYVEIIRDGLWKKNPGLVQLLGLCPLLAVSNTATNALGLGIATIFVLTLSNFLISLVRRFILSEVRIIIYVIIIACLVTCVQLLMEAYTPALYAKLGLYIALIVTNCIIIGRAEVFAVKHSPLQSLVDGLANGIGFALVLLCIGIVREVIGQGTIFDGLHELIGASGDALKVTLFSSEQGLLVAILPPGAFITLGLMIAGKNYWDLRHKPKATKQRDKITNLQKKE